MLERFYFIPFLVGLLFGILFLTFWKEEPQIVMRYPHPDNVNGRIYKDHNHTCYQYKSSEVNCDSNEETLKPYPLQ
jgi:hypothetical protein